MCIYAPESTVNIPLRKLWLGTSGAPESRSHGSVTLHPAHVPVLRTHSVQGGSLLSHTKEIKGVIYIQSVTLHPVHVSVRKRTHSVQGGSLLSHTKEILML